MERRKFQRIETYGISADVSDGTGFFLGTVQDVSRFGLCMSDMPKKLNDNVKKMTVVVSGKGEHFKMSVRPRWSTKNTPKKTVGAEILNAPWGWTEFVMNFEPSHGNAWGEIHL